MSLANIVHWTLLFMGMSLAFYAAIKVTKVSDLDSETKSLK